MSESSVSRRISWLISSGQISIRALVEPRVIGLAVEAILWVDLPQGAVEPLGNRLKDRQEVRYLAAVGGPHQLAVDVTLPSIARLYDFLAESMWSQHSARVQVDLVAEARKRGGRILPTSPSPTAAS